MNESDQADTRLSTGVPGLDGILRGGFPRGGVYIIEGPPGAGKTILGNQIAYHVASQGRDALYLTLLAESHSRLIGYLRSLRFFRPDLVGQHVHYASAFKTLEVEGLGGLLRLIREVMTKREPTLLVVDGLVSALEPSQTDRDYRKFIHELQTIAAMADCTVLLLVSVDLLPCSRPEHTMVDGIIEVSDALNSLRSLRHLQVRKLRGSDPVRGQHTLLITEQGIQVRQRIEADLLRLPVDAPLRPSHERATFGLHGLDQMLQGGLPRNSTTLLLGPSGSGKTLLGLQFLAAGAQRNERGIFFGFYERPTTLLAKAARVNIPLEEAQRSGLLHVLWKPFGEASVDVLSEGLLQAVRALRPRRLFLNGLQGFAQDVDVPGRLSSVLSAIAEQLEFSEVTTVYTLEAEGLLGHQSSSPIRGISAITHNLLALRQIELDARLYRTIGIIKMRDTGHDRDIHELSFSDAGIQITNTFRQRTGKVPAPPTALRSAARPRVEAAGDQRSILIVDDEFGLADLLAEILGERGHRTAVAINGELGLQSLRERGADLVLLDLMMPVLSGPEMLQQMRREPELCDIPVVLMTALPEAVPTEQAGQYQAVLHKPFTPQQLFEAINPILAAAREPRVKGASLGPAGAQGGAATK